MGGYRVVKAEESFNHQTWVTLTWAQSSISTGSNATAQGQKELPRCDRSMGTSKASHACSNCFNFPISNPSRDRRSETLR